MKNKNHTSFIKHLDLKNNDFDPYQLIIHKINRLSWGESKHSEKYIKKKEFVKWMYQLINISEELFNKIVIEGIINSEFHNISYILQLFDNPEFQSMNSNEYYNFLYDIIDSAPEAILGWIDRIDFLMSRNILALLANKG